MTEIQHETKARCVGRGLTLVVAILGIAGTPVRAQDLPTYSSSAVTPDPEFIPLGGYDGAFWYVDHDTLFAVDLPAGSTRVVRPVAELMTVFDRPYLPASYSASIDPETGEVWMWDGSVGPVARLKLGDPSADRTFDVYNSRTQASHAGALHPVTGRPLAFGGYGYYRVHDLFVTFDDRANTWVEVASRAQRRPEPRMGAVMVSGWHPTKVVVVGGTGKVSNDVPWKNDRVIADAWTFDFADSTWARVPLPEPVRCAALASSALVGDFIVEPRTRSVLLFSLFACPPDPAQDASEILRWYPESGRFETAARLGQAIPVGHALGGLVLSPDSGRVHVLLWKGGDGKRMATLDRQVITLDLARPTTGPRDDDGGSPPFWLAGLFLLVLVPVTFWIATRRSRDGSTVTVGLVGEGAPVRLGCGGRRVERPLTPNAYRMLAMLLRIEPPQGSVVSSDLLQALFDDVYADPDSSRVAKNRAIDELNDLFENACGRSLLKRVRRADDARRFDWRVLISIRRESP